MSGVVACRCNCCLRNEEWSKAPLGSLFSTNPKVELDIEKDVRILQLKNELVQAKEIIGKFIVKSNGLSMYVRSDIFGKCGMLSMEEELWSLYHYQCEVEELLDR